MGLSILLADVEEKLAADPGVSSMSRRGAGGGGVAGTIKLLRYDMVVALSYQLSTASFCDISGGTSTVLPLSKLPCIASPLRTCSCACAKKRLFSSTKRSPGVFTSQSLDLSFSATAFLLGMTLVFL